MHCALRRKRLSNTENLEQRSTDLIKLPNINQLSSIELTQEDFPVVNRKGLPLTRQSVSRFSLSSSP